MSGESSAVVKTNQPHFVACGVCGKQAPQDCKTQYQWVSDHFKEAHGPKDK